MTISPNQQSIKLRPSVSVVPIPIAISKDDTLQAIESLQRYFDENMDEPLGNLPAK